MAAKRPACTILAGPNGSGKSSLYEALKPAGLFINADRAAKLISPKNPEDASFAAGRRVLQALASSIRERQDFVYETTLSSEQPLGLMRRAKMEGYAIGLVFVVLASIDLNVERVAQRVARGGHDIPEPIIRRRYGRAIPKLGAALSLADETVVLDNTGDQPKVLLRISGLAVELNDLDLNVPTHASIANAVAMATRGSSSRST